MAISEYKKSAKILFEERLSSPLYGTFIISWVICNWKIIYLTLFIGQEQIKPLTKIEYISKYYFKWYNLTLYPLLSSIILITVIPWLGNKLFQVYLYYEKQRRTFREDLDSTKRLTISESAELRNEMFELNITHQKHLDHSDSEK
jgi:hypothetical protein